MKADAYGHGAPAIARVAEAEGVHSVGVATLDEGIELREHEVRGPIVILSPTLAEEAEAARQRLVEAVAETDDELLERYLEEGELDNDSLVKGLVAAVGSRGSSPSSADPRAGSSAPRRRCASSRSCFPRPPIGVSGRVAIWRTTPRSPSVPTL